MPHSFFGSMVDQSVNRTILLNEVKTQAKKLMEEAVFRSYVHEESTSITLLCASVEAVVKFGLRQHAFTIFDENSTLALCRRIAKLCPAAQQTLDRMDFHQHAMIWQSGTKLSAPQVALRDPLALVRQKLAINGATNGNSPSSFASSTTSGTWRNSLPLRVRNGNVMSKKSNVYRNGVGDTPYMKFTPNTTNVDPRLRNFWIRVALLEKVLDKILLFLTKNASRYYEKHAILADPCDGLLLADLLRGPCAIDYSRTRTTDHLYTDPPVSELIQRHGISGSLMSRELSYVPPSCQSWQVANRNLRATSIPNLYVNKENGSDLDVMETESHDGRLHVFEDSPRRSTPEPSQDLSRTSSVLSLSQATEVSSTASQILETERAGFSVSESLRVSRRNLASAAREHVESMHQSIRSMLVYGKNNIRVQTKDNDSPLPGYLSIHDHGKDLGIFVSWTPNWAMASDASTPSLSESWSRNCESTQRQPRLDNRCMQPNSALLNGYREAYWGYAIRIKVVDLVYIHCHESAEHSSAVFITKEGISLTPLLFSAKSHLDTFLHCLEQAIRKHHGHLEPPPVTDMVDESYSECEDQPVSNLFGKSPSRTLRLPSFFMSNSEYPNTEVNRNPFGFWSFTGDSNYSKLSEPKTPQTPVNPDQMINLHITGVHESSLSPQSSPEEVNVPTLKDTSRISRTFRIVFSNPKHKKIEDKLMERDVSERSMSVCPQDDEDFFDQPDIPADSIEVLCETIRRQIKLVTFRKWFSHGHRMRILRCRLTNIVAPDLLTIDHPSNAMEGVTTVLWNRLRSDPDPNFTFDELCRHVYFGNCDPSIRKQVWPYLLGVYPWDSSETELSRLEMLNKQFYTTSLQQWQACEAYLKKVDDQTENRSTCCQHSPSGSASSLIEVGTFEPSSLPSTELSAHDDDVRRVCEPSSHSIMNACDGVESMDGEICDLDSAPSAPLTPVAHTSANPGRRASSSIRFEFSATLSGHDPKSDIVSVVVSPPPTSNNPNSDGGHPVTEPLYEKYSAETLDALSLNLYRIDKDVSRCDRNHSFFANTKRNMDTSADIQSIPPPDQSELNANLQKLRNIICTWVWLHLDSGYVQGMCDLLAPLLIILEDEALAFACFCSLMEWMLPNFPLSKSRKSSTRVSNPVTSDPLPVAESQSHRSSAPAVRPTLLALSRRYSETCSEPTSNVSSPQPTSIHTTDGLNEKEPQQDFTHHPFTTFVPSVASPYGTSVVSQKMCHMDLRFANLKSLIELFDTKLHKYLCKKSIDTHFYFCYRWLLLDFKRELKYDEVYSVWEIIWASRRIVCYDLGIFFAMAMLQYYRDIIIYYDMDLTEIIRFYNELTEQHDVRTLLELARSLVFQMQKLMIDR